MKVLLDSSFLIDLLNELASGSPGPAVRWLKDHREARLWISAVTMAEVLEGAEDVDFVRRHLARYRWQGLHHAHAESVAVLQRRSRAKMGENDAWQVAVTLQMRGKIVGHDAEAFARLGAAYLDHRTP